MKILKKLLQTFSALLFSSGFLFFSACSSTSVSTPQNPLKISMDSWNYNEDDDVYWQVGISYAAFPADEQLESLGIFVPGQYFESKKNDDGTYSVRVNKSARAGNFTAKNAPFVMPVETPGYSEMKAPVSYVSAVKKYTDEGMIYVYAGARGRNHGAPLGVTDFKAAIRFVRYNSEVLPGDTERYFTYGMSGGGAQSALIGATGDASEYEPYLKEIGAVMSESDAIMGSMDWCPITNLNVANEAYEWELGSGRTNLDEKTKALSDALALNFAEYINLLGLKDENGNLLTLSQSADGLYHAGSYYEYLKTTIENSLNDFLKTTSFPYNVEEQKNALGNEMLGELPMMAGRGGQGRMPMDIEMRDNVKRTSTTFGIKLQGTYQTVEDYINALNENELWVIYNKESNTATVKSVEAFMRNLKVAAKSVGAFDDLNSSQGENTLFGYGDGSGVHWDKAMANALEKIDSSKAEEFKRDLSKKDFLGTTIQTRIDMYNPMYYLSPYYKGFKTAKPAQFWRIRSGIFQGDTAISTELDYALALKAYGSEVKSVDFATVWGLYHVKAEESGTSRENFIEWVKDCLK